MRPFMRVIDGCLVVSRCNFIYPDATDEDSGDLDKERYALVDRMDGDIILPAELGTDDLKHLERMLDVLFAKKG
jgi:hypothetical protein